MQKVNILLIDENEITRFYFRDAFWLHGAPGAYEISFASGFSQALELLQQSQTRPDIIFFDLVLHGNIGGRNVYAPQVGFELLKEIRSMPQFDPAKIVIFSSPKYFKLWNKAKSMGANYFLKNDQFLPRHLVNWVEEIITQYHGIDYRIKKS